jgi:DNA modification methylase
VTISPQPPSAGPPGNKCRAWKAAFVAVTQDALYRDIDLELSWSERDLPERRRTKHVHRLHPYLGKFVPQLVEVLLARYVAPAGRVLDPFAGSGTTLVQALESGYDAAGVDVAGFNAMLMRVKTRRYSLDALERDIELAVERVAGHNANRRYPPTAGRYLRAWFAPAAAEELLHARSLANEVGHADVAHADLLRVVVARAARSARRTTHFDLDFPRSPQIDEYWCYKHKRLCRPVETARQFLLRYLPDTLARVREFDDARADGRWAEVLHGDARELDLRGPYDGVVTSPPYPGLIDYHEQHRYAYELLGIADRRSHEVGSATRGTSRLALEEYIDGIAAVLRNVRSALRPDVPVCIVVNDRRDLYPSILRRAGFRLEERLERHVNRRTGRRAGEYFESVLVARAA